MNKLNINDFFVVIAYPYHSTVKYIEIEKFKEYKEAKKLVKQLKNFLKEQHYIIRQYDKKFTTLPYINSYSIHKYSGGKKFVKLYKKWMEIDKYGNFKDKESVLKSMQKSIKTKPTKKPLIED